MLLCQNILTCFGNYLSRLVAELSDADPHGQLQVRMRKQEEKAELLNQFDYNYLYNAMEPQRSNVNTKYAQIFNCETKEVNWIIIFTLVSGLRFLWTS